MPRQMLSRAHAKRASNSAVIACTASSSVSTILQPMILFGVNARRPVPPRQLNLSLIASKERVTDRNLRRRTEFKVVRRADKSFKSKQSIGNRLEQRARPSEFRRLCNVFAVPRTPMRLPRRIGSSITQSWFRGSLFEAAVPTAACLVGMLPRCTSAARQRRRAPSDRAGPRTRRAVTGVYGVHREWLRFLFRHSG